jgi:hypothetical protein
MLRQGKAQVDKVWRGLGYCAAVKKTKYSAIVVEAARERSGVGDG